MITPPQWSSLSRLNLVMPYHHTWDSSLRTGESGTLRGSNPRQSNGRLVVDGATTAPCPLEYNDWNLLFSLNSFTFNIKFLGFLTVGHSTVVGTTANHTSVGGSIPVPWPTVSSLFPVHILLVALRRSDVLIDVYYKRPHTYKRLRILRWEIQWAHVWWYGITRMSRPLRG